MQAKMQTPRMSHLQAPCNLLAQLHCHFAVCRLRLALTRSLAAKLPRFQSTADCQLRCTPIRPAAVFQPIRNQLIGNQLQDISSAMKCKLLCNLSSQLQPVCSVMICRLHQTLHNSFKASLCQNGMHAHVLPSISSKTQQCPERSID